MRPLRAFRSKLPDSPLNAALLKYREDNHLSLRVMAEHLRLHWPQLTRLFHDGTASPRMFKRLAEFFQWTPTEVGEMLVWDPPPKKKRRKKHDE